MITAIILAAGQSKRMGQPKMLMPWGESTVLETVISTVQTAGISDILIVTGGAHSQVEALVGKTAQIIFNENYPTGEMLGSIQRGLTARIPSEAQAVLICLGDQPQVQEGSVRAVCDAFFADQPPIVVPSYKMHRGHPWLLARPLWEELMAIRTPQTPRDFLKTHADQIRYVELNDPNILEDLDTPEDYLRFRS